MPGEPPYGLIANGLKKGKVIPFFGAAASAIYRPSGGKWKPGEPFMPFGGELARNLAEEASFGDVGDEELDLAFIASWVEHCQGTRSDVNSALRRSFLVDAKPGGLHKALAKLPRLRLYITTNYDDLLEKALDSRNPFVITDCGARGLWLRAPGGAPERVQASNLRRIIEDAVTGEPSAPVIFKMHGSISREDEKHDSYLITEEDYVDFLGKAGGKYLPPYIHDLLAGKKLLFLGYSLEDWNVRVIVRKLLRSLPPNDRRFYAIVKGRSERAQDIWHAHDLNIYSMNLLEFVQKLVKKL